MAVEVVSGAADALPAEGEGQGQESPGKGQAPATTAGQEGEAAAATGGAPEEAAGEAQEEGAGEAAAAAPAEAEAEAAAQATGPAEEEGEQQALAEGAQAPQTAEAAPEAGGPRGPGRKSAPPSPEKAAEATAFDGRWLHERSPSVAEIIRGGIIHGPDGTTTRVTCEDAGALSIDFNGATYRAQLRGSRLCWDDGDVWIRARTDFDGCWRHRSNPAISHLIWDDTIRGPDGSEAKIIFSADVNRFCISLQGSTYRARLVEHQLLWDDGDVWVRARRKEGLEGRWRHRGKDVLESIRGDIIHGPDGLQTRINHVSESRFSIDLNGRTHSAQLVGDEIIWDDGDVWIHVPAAEGIEGPWRHKEAPELVEVVLGGVVQGPDGAEARITEQADDMLAIDSDGQTCKAQLVNDELVWSDGKVWVRA